MSLTLPVECVSETAFITAYCRALETDRPDAHFRDPHARRLAGVRGQESLKKIPGGESGAVGCIVRTCLVDELILTAFQETAIDTVINFGAGLDARPYRLPLPETTHWIEIDNPEVLSYKAQALEGYTPMCRLDSIPLDVANAGQRQAFCRRVSETSQNALIITEGLLVYMSPEQVAALAGDFSRWPQFRYWVSDLVSPNAFHLARETVAFAPDSDAVTQSAGANQTQHIAMHFAPETGADFFREFGWETAICRWSVEEGRRLERRYFPDSLLAGLSVEQRDAVCRLNAVVTLRRMESRCAPDEMNSADSRPTLARRAVALAGGAQTLDESEG
jgi:methyltransferase (TIGR00027 family)